MILTVEFFVHCSTKLVCAVSVPAWPGLMFLMVLILYKNLTLLLFLKRDPAETQPELGLSQNINSSNDLCLIFLVFSVLVNLLL